MSRFRWNLFDAHVWLRVYDYWLRRVHEQSVEFCSQQRITGLTGASFTIKISQV